MNIFRVAAAAAAIMLFFGNASATNGQNSLQFQFVQEYIRQVSEVDSLRDRAAANLAKDGSNYLGDCVADTTALALELGLQSAIIRKYSLPDQFKEVPVDIARFYDSKRDYYKKISDTCASMMAGPKAGVDYGAMVADIPRLRAQIDFIDKSLFEAAPLICLMLVDERADAQGRASHLIITKAEHDKLLDQLDSEFGSKMDAKEPNYLVAVAMTLRVMLLKDYKNADDPW